jgi:hypothetical protein
MIDAKAERHYILQMIEELRQLYPVARAGFDELERRIRKHEKDWEQPKPKDPLPKTEGELVTPKQISAIWGNARARGLNAEIVCRSEFKCPVRELNRTAASWLIDFLKSSEATIEHRQAG